MPESQSKFLKDLIDKNAPVPDEPKSFSSERQHTAQAFNLQVEWRDGRRKEGFAWSHYVGYRWVDEGQTEKLTVIFGDRAVEIEGLNLGVLVADIRDGQLNSIRELASGQGKLLQHANPENQPIITGVQSYPDFEEILTQLKGERNDEARHTRRFER